MKKKEILQLIEVRLREGHSKKDIYDELLLKMSPKANLLQYVAMVPDFSDRKKYQKINLFLFWTLLLIFIWKFILSILLINFFNPQTIPSLILFDWIHFVVPIFVIWVAIEVWKFRGYIYKIICMLGILDLMLNINYLTKFVSYTVFTVTLWALFTFTTLIAVILAYLIGKNVFPYYGWPGLKPERLDFYSPKVKRKT